MERSKSSPASSIIEANLRVGLKILFLNGIVAALISFLVNAAGKRLSNKVLNVSLYSSILSASSIPSISSGKDSAYSKIEFK